MARASLTPQAKERRSRVLFLRRGVILRKRDLIRTTLGYVENKVNLDEGATAVKAHFHPEDRDAESFHRDRDHLKAMSLSLSKELVRRHVLPIRRSLR